MQSASTIEHGKKHLTSQEEAHRTTSYSVPIWAVMVNAHPLGDDDRPLADWNQGIDMRTGWNGDDADPGNLDVKFEGAWTPLEKVAPSLENEIVEAEECEGEEHPVTCIRLVRGPHHPNVSFAARLVPISWCEVPEHHTEIVTRGDHYSHARAPMPEDWVESQADADGVHRLELNDLVVGDDYELWVRLQHHENEGVDKLQDPVIRTRPSGGGSAE